MKLCARSVRSKLQKGDTLKTKTDDEALLSVLVALFPDAAFSRQHLLVLICETIKARTPYARFAFHYEAQADRKLSETLLISLDRSEACNQIAFAVGSATRVEFAVNDCRREWS